MINNELINDLKPMEPTPKSELKDGKVYLCWNTKDYVRISHGKTGKPVAYWTNRKGGHFFDFTESKKHLHNNHIFYEVDSEFELLFSAKKEALFLLERLELNKRNSIIINAIVKTLQDYLNGTSTA